VQKQNGIQIKFLTKILAAIDYYFLPSLTSKKNPAASNNLTILAQLLTFFSNWQEQHKNQRFIKLPLGAKTIN
jgi:hypothetical protein